MRWDIPDGMQPQDRLSQRSVASFSTTPRVEYFPDADLHPYTSPG